MTMILVMSRTSTDDDYNAGDLKKDPTRNQVLSWWLKCYYKKPGTLPSFSHGRQDSIAVSRWTEPIWLVLGFDDCDDDAYDDDDDDCSQW